MAEKPKRGLGRGFDSLISADFDKNILLTAEDRIEKLDVTKLQANPNQPRRHFDETKLKELAASIKRHGVVQPVVVTPVKDGIYTLVAGERRWRASQLAGLKTIPALVRARKELEQMEIALIENVQRVDLSPLEQAISIERLRQQFSLNYDQIGQRLGKAASTVSNIGRLLQLPPDARDALNEERITEGHARTILSLKNMPDKQTDLLKAIIKHGWNVRQAERFVTSIKKEGEAETTKAAERAQTETPATKRLSKRLKTPVHIKRMANGGRLEIGFRTDEELERIINSIQ